MPEQLMPWLKKIWEILTFSAFKVGQKDISLLLIAEVLALLVLGLICTKLLTRVLKARLEKTHLDEGIQYTLVRLVHYSIAGIVLYQAIRMLGLNLTGLAFFAGIISVGIGFGLQNIANNFVSGLILLFERPVKPGDMVTVGDTDGRVTEIKMRATTVVTRDNVTILVPNSQFVSEEVTNWSHTDPKVRIHVPVGRDVYDHTIQVAELIESYRDILTEMFNVYLSVTANKTNEVMRVLTIFATIFIPLTFIAGIYGMNFEFMPELKWRPAYFIMLGLMVAISVVMLRFFRKRGWM